MYSLEGITIYAAIAYPLGTVSTLVYLLMADMPDASNFFSGLVIFLCDVFLSGIWPIYWAVLHWI